MRTHVVTHAYNIDVGASALHKPINHTLVYFETFFSIGVGDGAAKHNGQVEHELFFGLGNKPWDTFHKVRISVADKLRLLLRLGLLLRLRLLLRLLLRLRLLSRLRLRPLRSSTLLWFTSASGHRRLGASKIGDERLECHPRQHRKRNRRSYCSRYTL